MKVTSEDAHRWMRHKRRELHHASIQPKRIAVPWELHYALGSYMREQDDTLGIDSFRYNGELLFRRIPVVCADARRDGFLWAIIESPDDDLPKLVYADWLAEQRDFEEEAYWRGCARTA